MWSTVDRCACGCVRTPLGAAYVPVDFNIVAQVSTVSVMRLVLRWACTHCGCDVPEVCAHLGAWSSDRLIVTLVLFVTGV